MTFIANQWQKVLLFAATCLVVVLVAGAVGVDHTRDSATPTADRSPAATAAVDSDATGAAVKILVIGDSVTEGTDYGGRGVNNWTATVQRALSTETLNTCPVLLRVSGRGGSGHATSGSRHTTFGSETERLLTADVSAVVYVGSGNDLSQLSMNYVDSVTRTIEIAHTKNPATQVVVVGPPWIHDTPVSDQYLRANELLAAAAQSADAVFVDPIASGWFDDAPATGIVGGDNRHPTDAGHAIIAEHMQPVLEDLARAGRCA